MSYLVYSDHEATIIRVITAPLKKDPKEASPPNSRGTAGAFYMHFYNHAHRLRLEKLLFLELSRSPNGFF